LNSYIHPKKTNQRSIWYESLKTISSANKTLNSIQVKAKHIERSKTQR